jgi:hypothetical protein
MKRFLALALVVALVGLGMPLSAFAGQQNGTLSGVVKDSGGSPVSNAGIRLRNTGTGQVVATSRTNSNGEFTFNNLPQANYVVEVIGDDAKIIGASTGLSLAAGGTMTGIVVTVTSGTGAAAAAAAGGVGAFFTSTTGIVLLAAAGAGVTAGIIVATRSASK